MDAEQKSVMGRAHSSLNDLYLNFLARDVAAKVVPGAFLSWALVARLPEPNIIFASVSSAGLLLGAMYVFMFWFVGFALQMLGRRLGLVKYYRERLFSKDPDGLEAGTAYSLQKWKERELELWGIASPRELLQYERLVVLKEACGNAALSLLMSATIILLPVSDSPAWLGMLLPGEQLLLGSFLILLVSSLYYGHLTHANMQSDFLVQALTRHQRLTPPSPSPSPAPSRTSPP